MQKLGGKVLDISSPLAAKPSFDPAILFSFFPLPSFSPFFQPSLVSPIICKIAAAIFSSLFLLPSFRGILKSAARREGEERRGQQKKLPYFLLPSGPLNLWDIISITGRKRGREEGGKACCNLSEQKEGKKEGKAKRQKAEFPLLPAKNPILRRRLLLPILLLFSPCLFPVVVVALLLLLLSPFLSRARMSERREGYLIPAPPLSLFRLSPQRRRGRESSIGGASCWP